MPASFAPAAALVGPPAPRRCWFVFNPDGLLVHEEEERATLPELEASARPDLPLDGEHYLGRLDELDCFAASAAAGAAAPAGWAFRGLRRLFGRLDEARFAVAGRASQVAHWDQTHRYCGRCGTPTSLVEGERARRCPKCELSAYPRLSPAVIVLVRKGREALLARAANFPAAFYSTLAGFVEPGETLEETVVREIREEVGVEVRNLRYFGSQPWPFPHSLMIGFMAEYAGGELRPDGKEILDARWYSPDALPQVPPRLSISRQLIDTWVESELGTRT